MDLGVLTGQEQRSDFGPEVLLPSFDPQDDVKLKVAGRIIHKSQLYDRMLEEDPLRVKQSADRLVFHILLAQKALEHEIRLDPAKVQRLVQADEKELLRSLQEQWQGALDADAYLQQLFGMDLQQYRRWRPTTLARKLYMDLTIRYLQMLEDRVQVRLLVHSDQQLLEETRERVRQGAEFASLALRLSEDKETRHDGGRLSPISRDSKSTFTQVAFALQPGEVSTVQPLSVAGRKTYYLLYCIRHIQGRQEPFAQVQQELEEDLQKNPVTAGESHATLLRLRIRSEELNSSGQNR